MRAHLIAAVVVPVLVLGYLLHLTASQPKRIDLRVTPHLALAPADVSIIAHVPRDQSNRQLEILCTGTEYERVSTRQLDGNLEPTTQYSLWLRDVPEGAYLISARLITTERDYEVADRIELHGR